MTARWTRQLTPLILGFLAGVTASFVERLMVPSLTPPDPHQQRLLHHIYVA